MRSVSVPVSVSRMPLVFFYRVCVIISRSLTLSCSLSSSSWSSLSSSSSSDSLLAVFVSIVFKQFVYIVTFCSQLCVWFYIVCVYLVCIRCYCSVLHFCICASININSEVNNNTQCNSKECQRIWLYDRNEFTRRTHKINDQQHRVLNLFDGVIKWLNHKFVVCDKFRSFSWYVMLILWHTHHAIRYFFKFPILIAIKEKKICTILN